MAKKAKTPKKASKPMPMKNMAPPFAKGGKAGKGGKKC